MTDQDIILLLKEFYIEYYHNQLNLTKKILPENVSSDLFFSKDLNFAPEELNDFVSAYSERFKIDVSKFYQNTHTEGISYELALLPTNILLPFVGLKKWMVFKKKQEYH